VCVWVPRPLHDCVSVMCVYGRTVRDEGSVRETSLRRAYPCFYACACVCVCP
jgi:hypothetical protein